MGGRNGCITGEEIKSIHCSESDRVYLSHLLLLMNVCKGLRIQQQLLVSIVISYMVFFGKVTALQQYRFSNYNNNVVVRKLFSSKTTTTTTTTTIRRMMSAANNENADALAKKRTTIDIDVVSDTV